MTEPSSSLWIALITIAKPLCLLFPFKAAHFHHVFIRIFILSGTLEADSIWAHRFFSLLHFFSITPQQFSAILPSSLSASTIAMVARETELMISSSVPTNFCARPTLLLRVITPTGYSIVIRALIDTGTSKTTVFSELADLLQKNGVTSQYSWPYEIITFDYVGQETCMLSGVKLQSLEDESIIVSTNAILVNKCAPYDIDYTPVELLITKMASLGLKMVSKPMRNTIWSKEKPK